MNKGAEQAQHEANNAPWLTTAHMICTDAGIAHGPISERMATLRDKLADKAQQTTEETDAEMALRSIASWLGVGGFNAPTVDAKVFEQKIYEGVEMAIKSHYVAAEEPKLPEAVDLNPSANCVMGYTAAQMHDHFAAGVRAGMGQSQDAKRLDWVESQGNGSGWLARNSITNRGYRIHNDKDAKHKTVREAIDSAMQGDSQ